LVNTGITWVGGGIVRVVEVLKGMLDRSSRNLPITKRWWKVSYEGG